MEFLLQLEKNQTMLNNVKTQHNRPKSQKQVVAAPLPKLGNRYECHGSSEMTIIKSQ